MDFWRHDLVPREHEDDNKHSRFWPIESDRRWFMKRLKGMIIFLLLPWFFNA